jgi:Ca2+/Na+ antiporter
MGSLGPPHWTDLWELSAMTLVAAFFLRKQRAMVRWEGASLLAGYTVFMAYLVMTR